MCISDCKKNTVKSLYLDLGKFTKISLFKLSKKKNFEESKKKYTKRPKKYIKRESFTVSPKNWLPELKKWPKI